MDKSDKGGGTVPPEKLVKVYLKMRQARDTMVKAHETELEKLESAMKLVKQGLLDYCKDQSVDSVRLADGSGMFYRTIRKRFWTSDWDAMNRFILKHAVPELLEKRLHQGNTQAFLEQHPDLLPPGLNVDSEYTITVRRT